MNYLNNQSITRKWYPKKFMKVNSKLEAIRKKTPDSVKREIDKHFMVLSDLKEGDQVTVKGIQMTFSEWQNDVPVFYWINESGVQINFSTTDFNRETLLKDIA